MSLDIDINTDERIDEIGFGNIKIIQRPKDFCYGIDAVLLADFVGREFKDRQKVNLADLGTGNGIIPLILSHKMNKPKITAIEVQGEVSRLAQRNVEMNQLDDNIKILNCDILNIIREGNELHETMDVVVSNPPYGEENTCLKTETKARAIARYESSAKLGDFLKVASYMLKPNGSFFMIHRPSRLVDIFYKAREFCLEPKVLRMVSPAVGRSANLVLVHMKKRGGKELKVLPELYVYMADGRFSDEINLIYERNDR